MSANRRRFCFMLGATIAGYAGASAAASPSPAPANPTVYRISVIPPPGGYRRRQRALWGKGYSQMELDVAQAKYSLEFPPDLVAFLREKRPLDGYDWRTDDKAIREILDWPFEGLLFDVEDGWLWWPEWGERPNSPEERKAVLRGVVDKAPKLVPLISHRYIPVTPHEAGNPVFSIYQSDVIYYGADLEDYFDRELVNPDRPFPAKIKHIPFWSDIVDWNDKRARTAGVGG